MPQFLGNCPVGCPLCREEQWEEESEFYPEDIVDDEIDEEENELNA